MTDRKTDMIFPLCVQFMNFLKEHKIADNNLRSPYRQTHKGQ